MVVFKVYLNGKKICVAGVGDLGVLSTCLCWRGPQPYKNGERLVAEYIRLDVGGISSLKSDIRESWEHVRWQDRKVKRGDTVTIKVVESALADRPRSRERPDPAADLRRRKQYVRRMAKELGWKIQTGPGITSRLTERRRAR